MATETVKLHDQCQAAVSLPQTSPRLHCRHCTAGVFFKWKNEKKKLEKERKKIRREKESATESNPSLSFSATAPTPSHTGLTRSSIPRPVSSSPRLPPIQASSPRLSSSPAPKAPTFPSFYLASTAWVRPGKQRILAFVALLAAARVLLQRFLSAPGSSVRPCSISLRGLRCSLWIPPLWLLSVS